MYFHFCIIDLIAFFQYAFFSCEIGQFLKTGATSFASAKGPGPQLIINVKNVKRQKCFSKVT